MSEVLIVFDSEHGQTEKIARAMAKTVEVMGHTAEVVRVTDHFGMARCDAVMVGGAIHASTHSQRLKSFLKANLPILRSVPTAIFSVSLSAGGNEDQRRDARKCLQSLLDELRFQPTDKMIIAGALKYRSYGPLKRLMMKLIVYLAGGDTDTSRDYEYTDWEELNRFVERFLDRAGFEAFPPKDLVQN